MHNEGDIVKNNILEVAAKIKKACEKAGRSADEVTLMAVSKTQPTEKLQHALDVGLTLFGENRVQELREKADFFRSAGAECHIIGTLQKNKVKYLPQITSFIQSVDSLPLAQEIEKQYAKNNMTASVLLQVNVANEDTKSGVLPQCVPELAKKISELKHVKLCGLMCIPPPITGDGTQIRTYFAKMRELFFSLKSQDLPGACISVLSMGMSDDFEIAIEEGSTLVRVGSALFGHR